jgi:hypothetical protein
MIANVPRSWDLNGIYRAQMGHRFWGFNYGEVSNLDKQGNLIYVMNSPSWPSIMTLMKPLMWSPSHLLVTYPMTASSIFCLTQPIHLSRNHLRSFYSPLQCHTPYSSLSNSTCSPIAKTITPQRDLHYSLMIAPSCHNQPTAPQLLSVRLLIGW